MIMLIGTMTALGPLCIDMYIPSLPVIGRQLEASPSAVQLSITACLIGLALGQIVIGTLSDSMGRRRPLLGGLMLFVVASLACSLAPNIASLVGLRFAQGFGGAAGIVVGRAIVRDTYSGHRLARFFSLLVLVTGLGPLVAPQVGAALLHLGSWRVLFMFLAVVGAAIVALAAAQIPETLPVAWRTSARLTETLRSMGRIATDRRFALVALAGGLAIGALFAYVAGSAFVLETVYGLSPQAYSMTFTMNAVVLIAASQVSARLVQPGRSAQAAAGRRDRARRRVTVLSGSCARRPAAAARSAGVFPRGRRLERVHRAQFDHDRADKRPARGRDRLGAGRRRSVLVRRTDGSAGRAGRRARHDADGDHHGDVRGPGVRAGLAGSPINCRHLYIQNSQHRLS
jgi:Bcr/CflA subfamily drug resistance transporter